MFQTSKRLKFLGIAILGGILLFQAHTSFAQKHRYRLIGNRYEGIKTKIWKPVSGEVKMESLVFVGDKTQTTQPVGDNIAMFFYSTITSDIEPIVFKLEQQYFMQPFAKKVKFGKDWNEFTWPAKILNDIKLPVSDLSGIVKGQKGKVYFPICFKKPDSIGNNSILKTTLIADKDMTVNISLYDAASDKPLKSWDNQSLKSDAPFDFEIPGNLFANKQTLVMKVAEQGAREFSYQIQLFGK